MEAAISLAENGIPVFPLNPKDKTPITKNGVKDATTDISKIKAWWIKWPLANVAVPMGKASGLIAVDIDYKDGCDPKFLEKLPPTVIVKSPNGGHHAYFKYKNGPIKNNLKLEKGATIRSDGYYFVVPPSELGGGKCYEFINGDLTKVDLDPPEWFSELGISEVENKEPFKLKNEIPKGEQHIDLFKFGCSLRAKGMTELEIVSAFLTANDRLQEPAPRENLEKLAIDICKRYKQGNENTRGDEGATNNENNYLECLGHSGNEYFYTSSSNKQITTMSASSHSDLNLCNLMPYHYWIDKFPKRDLDGLVTGVNWKQAAYSLMNECRSRGVFSFKKVRGVGCWIDNRKLILHLGDRLLVDGLECDLHKIKTEFIYKLSQSISSPSTTALSISDCQHLLKSCEALNWKRENSKILFPGFLALSRVCGALPWRPQGWLTGPAGSGKTTILETLVKNIFGDWGIGITSNTTEAGIRQNIGCDSRPVYFDEAETTGEKSHRRMQGVLELIRQASSESDSRIMKGTSDGKGFHYKVNSLFLLSSIRVNLSEEADKSRFCIFELDRGNSDGWKGVSELLFKIDKDYGDKLFSRMVNGFFVVLENYKIFSSLIAKSTNQRIGQQYGIILASYFHLISDSICGVDEAKKIINCVDIANSTDVLSGERDEAECLDYLMNTKITISEKNTFGSEIKKDYSIGGIISLIHKENKNISFDKDMFRGQLKMYGLDFIEDRIVVSTNHPQLHKLFIGSKWQEKMWSQSLLRLSGSKKERHRFSSPNPIWSVFILCDHVFNSKFMQ